MPVPKVEAAHGAPPGVARAGTLLENLGGFARALRRAGVPVDSARMALASEALRLVGVERREDAGAALEAVLVGRAQDREVFRELFDAYFRDPDLARPLLERMLPAAEAPAAAPAGRARVREALAPPRAPPRADAHGPDERIEGDAAMSASDLARLRQADFQSLAASEYRLVERLAREVRLPLPSYATRRARPGLRGARMHWPGVMRQAARTGGELLQLPRLARRRAPLPLLVLVDVSGSMERYARLLLAFLHAATRGLRRRDLFAFGTGLTDLGEALREPDTDRMLAVAGRAIQDFAGGTQLGASLAALRRGHARRLVGRRTLVLLITDGLDTGEPGLLAGELDWLRRHCHRLLWLNPLLRFEAYAPLARGAAVLHARADGMLAVHNLERLEELAGAIARLLAR